MNINVKHNCTNEIIIIGSSLAAAELVADVYVIGNANQNPKMTYIDRFSSCFDNLQQYNNYLTRHSDVNVVCRQPVCRYAAPPLLKRSVVILLILVYSTFISLCVYFYVFTCVLCAV